jgi:cysteine desulfurase
MNQPLYFDYAAATPLDPEVLKAMLPYFAGHFYNPSATYLPAVAVRKDIENARSQVAQIIGSRPSEIIFTSGATEANNLVVRGVLEQYPEGNIVVSSIEHDSVLLPARQFANQELPVTKQGIIDLDQVRSIVDDQTVLVSVMYANNEVGTIQPIHQLSLLLQEMRRERRQQGNALPLYLHTDAAQTPSYLDLHVSRLGVDFMTLNGGKIYGPKQTGILFAGSHTRFAPQIVGGGHERGLRAGTENVAGIIGFGRALQIAQERRHDETPRLQVLQRLFITELQKAFPDVIINGSLKNRLPNNVHVTLPGRDNERLLMALDDAGILCAAGSACSASSEEPSHVLRAMGISDADAQSSLRFTMGRDTDEAAIRQLIQTFITVS